MDFVLKLVPYFREIFVMLVLGLILCAVGLLQRFFQFDLTLALGLALLSVYIPLGVWVLISTRRARKAEQEQARRNALPFPYAEIMRQADEAITRSRAALGR